MLCLQTLVPGCSSACELAAFAALFCLLLYDSVHSAVSCSQCALVVLPFVRQQICHSSTSVLTKSLSIPVQVPHRLEKHVCVLAAVKTLSIESTSQIGEPCLCPSCRYNTWHREHFTDTKHSSVSSLLLQHITQEPWDAESLARVAKQ